jgi:hypothetical protein
MKNNHFISVLLFSVLLLSCESGLDTNECKGLFVAEVESLIAPDTILVSDTLKIRVRGILGSLGCEELELYESYTTNNVFDLTVWGRHTGCTCLGVNSGFDDTLFVNTHQHGNFRIIGHQPGGGFLKDSVYVR